MTIIAVDMWSEIKEMAREYHSMEWTDLWHEPCVQLEELIERAVLDELANGYTMEEDILRDLRRVLHLLEYVTDRVAEINKPVEVQLDCLIKLGRAALHQLEQEVRHGN